MKRILLLVFWCSVGNTGLLHAPTADMQRDKTFMLGGNVLDITPLHYYDFDVRYTFNYYLNITVFPGWKWDIPVR